MGRRVNKYQWIHSTLCICLGLLLLTFTGCAGREDSADSGTTTAASAPEASNSDSAAPTGSSANAKANGGSGGKGASNPSKPAVVPRKIIYDATVDIVTESLTTAQQKLLHLVKTYNGYIAETEVGGQAGTQRSGTWKIRIPAEQFETCMADISKLGELQSTQTKSQDVTAEFYDVQAHIANKQIEEQRLVALLQKSTARLQDILTVERELSRVRGEIEELQGRLRVLSNLTALSTITVSLHETKEFVPPKPTTFGDQAVRTFHESVKALLNLLENLLLIIVGFVPWAVAAIPLVLVGWFIKRRSDRKAKD